MSRDGSGGVFNPIVKLVWPTTIGVTRYRAPRFLSLVTRVFVFLALISASGVSTASAALALTWTALSCPPDHGRIVDGRC